MKTPMLLMIVVAVALVAGAGGSQLGRQQSERPAGEDGDEGRRLASILDRLESMEGQQAALRQSLDGLALSGSAASRAPAVSAADIDAAVARYLDQQHEAQLASVEPAGEGAPAAAGGLDPQAVFARLLDTTLDHDERQALWDQAREEGQLDQLVALFEQRALDNPRDPAAQVDLGEAYIQKIFEVGDGPAAGGWALKADQAYDAALVLDERHWDARFNKAVALSFWPPIFGKQAEAIGQLQTLIEQQSGQAPQPNFVQSYLALGNLYLQSGKSEQAQAVFAAGLKLFPNDAELLAKSSP